MKTTFGHNLPYPEPNDMMDGAAQLEQLAWAMDSYLLDLDQDWLNMNAARFGAKFALVGTDTGFPANTDGYVNFDTDEYMFLGGGGWDGSRVNTGDQDIPHNSYPSLWLIQGALRMQASGSVTAQSWRVLMFELQHIDPVSGELVTERPYVRNRTKGTSVDGITFAHLVRLEAPTTIGTIFRHNNTGSSMNVLPGSHMSITRIGECD